MMGGLAYGTGPEGQPMRAGISVNDIIGGMFVAIDALASLHQCDQCDQCDQRQDGTGRGLEVQSTRFENNVPLLGQHMMQYAVTGQPPAPMPGRISAWAVYDMFAVAGCGQIFLAAVDDRQWAPSCREFSFDDLLADPRLASNNEWVGARSWMLALLCQRLTAFSAAELGANRGESRRIVCHMRWSRVRRACSTTPHCAPPAAWPRWQRQPTPAAPARLSTLTWRYCR